MFLHFYGRLRKFVSFKIHPSSPPPLISIVTRSVSIGSCFLLTALTLCPHLFSPQVDDLTGADEEELRELILKHK